jgi:hypothetical protein
VEESLSVLAVLRKETVTVEDTKAAALQTAAADGCQPRHGADADDADDERELVRHTC